MTVLADLTFVPVPCALCGERRPTPVARVTSFSVPLEIVRCGDCRHVYLDPRPSDADLPKLYDEEYYAGGGDYSYADDRERAAEAAIRAAARLERIEELVEPGRLLEVGCSFGAFLLAARERGWEADGVDLSPYAVAACRERGLPVAEGALETVGPADGSRDVVYLAETVEHLPDPRATLAAAARALRPGGLLVVGTANHASLARVLRGRRWGYYMPGHLQYFSAASLARLMEEEGVPVVRRRFGDDRRGRHLAAARRAAGDQRGVLLRLRDAVSRVSFGGFSLGAGMILYGRREE